MHVGVYLDLPRMHAGYSASAVFTRVQEILPLVDISGYAYFALAVELQRREMTAADAYVSSACTGGSHWYRGHGNGYIQSLGSTAACVETKWSIEKGEMHGTGVMCFS